MRSVATSVPGGDEIGTGRFILLHDPAGNDAWDGTFRCVTFARADIEADMAADPSLPSVGWTWLADALQAQDAEYHAFSGSVTVVHTEGFGDMASDGADAQIELRASWTPGGGVGAARHRVVRPALHAGRPTSGRSRRHPAST